MPVLVFTIETAASGMAAQQTNLEIIADNLANADVAGFKGAAASFTDVNAGGTLGLGTAALGRHPLFEQGKLMKSGGPFDLAIDGAGFFRIEKDGATAYTRAGEFSRAADGSLQNADGWRLRLRAERLGTGWFTVEQQAYADTDDSGRIAGLDLLCTGFRPEGDHD